MARMTHLIRRGAVYWFRFKLPADLARKPVPDDWPPSLAALVSANHTPRRLKVEMTRSLGTKDAKNAKQGAALASIDAERLCESARRFLAGEAVTGSGAELTPDLREALANEHRADLLAIDEDLRKQGIDAARPLLLNKDAPHEPGMTGYDLRVYSEHIDAKERDVRAAIAASRPLPLTKKRAAQHTSPLECCSPKAPQRCETLS